MTASDMTTGDTTFGPEWAVLEGLARGLETPDERTAFAALVYGGLDWGEVIEQALRHRMLPMVAHAIGDLELHDAIPLRVSEHLRSVLALNLYRRDVWYTEAGRVVAALEDSGIPVAARKGAAYESDLYGGNGSRWLGDLDLLIRPEDRDAASALMPKLGYRVGLYDFNRRVIVKFERTELMKYRLNPDHLPTQSLVTSDPLVPVLEVDFANSLTWARAEYQVPVTPIFESLERYEVTGVPGLSLPRPAPAFRFLDTVLHLFREAWFEWWLGKEQDVDLMKFGDVIRLWRAHHAVLTDGRFSKEIKDYGIGRPVGWVLTHLDRTFGLTTLDALDLGGEIDEDYLASAGGSLGRPRAWQGTMRDRLLTKDRRAVFATEPTVSEADG
ncbi:nucleotidyltransferase family protein [Streptosporangium sp. NPDC006013]|uniref:nucleotidyltransferase domain-containing protein n=1 Tax=Streptosporangium sp. NPDC006013 TaxID=3155596 RepID=UPI0033A909B2